MSFIANTKPHKGFFRDYCTSKGCEELGTKKAVFDGTAIVYCDEHAKGKRCLITNHDQKTIEGDSV